jgi:hypothetical protein
MMIKISLSLSPDDYYEYQQVYLARIAGFWQRNHFRVFVTFGIIVLLAGLNWVFIEHRENYTGLVAIAGGLYLVFSGVWGRLRWRRWFLKNMHLYQDLEGEITEESLTVRSKTEETRTRWEHYARFIESRNLLVLMDPQENCLIIPKRAFAQADLESFLQVLNRRMAMAQVGNMRSTQE